MKLKNPANKLRLDFVCVALGLACAAYAFSTGVKIREDYTELARTKYSHGYISGNSRVYNDLSAEAKKQYDANHQVSKRPQSSEWNTYLKDQDTGYPTRIKRALQNIEFKERMFILSFTASLSLALAASLCRRPKPVSANVPQGPQ